MGTVKKIPMRKCVGCGEMKNKKEMQNKAFIENQANYRKNEYFRRKRDKQK